MTERLPRVNQADRARISILLGVAEVALELEIDPDAAMLAAEALAEVRGCSLHVAALRIRDRLRQLVEEWDGEAWEKKFGTD